MARQSPIRRSLERKPTTMGVDYGLFMIELLIGMVLWASKVYVALPFMIPLHIFLRYMQKRDDSWFNAYDAYGKQHDYYDPHIRPKHVRKRPKGFGRDLLC